jgi:hypothetical protein
MREVLWVLEKAFIVVVCVTLFAIFGLPALALMCYTLCRAMNFLTAMTAEGWAVGIFIIIFGGFSCAILNAWRHRYEN